MASAIGNGPKLAPEISADTHANLCGERIILLGMQACGKSTFVNEVEDLRNNYVSVGDIARSLEEDSEEKRQLDRIFQSGKPSGTADFFIGLVDPRLRQLREQDRGYVLDGIPKKTGETQPLIDHLKAISSVPSLVVCCDIDPDVARERYVGRPKRLDEIQTQDVFYARMHRYLRDLPSIVYQLEEVVTDFIILDMEVEPEQIVSQFLNEYCKLRDGDT